MAIIFASAVDNVIGLGLALAVVAYLVIVLIFPEKF